MEEEGSPINAEELNSDIGGLKTERIQKLKMNILYGVIAALLLIIIIILIIVLSTHKNENSENNGSSEDKKKKMMILLLRKKYLERLNVNMI